MSDIKKKVKECKDKKKLYNLGTGRCVSVDFAKKEKLKRDGRRGVAGTESEFNEYVLTFKRSSKRSFSKSKGKKKASPSKRSSKAKSLEKEFKEALKACVQEGDSQSCSRAVKASKKASPSLKKKLEKEFEIALKGCLKTDAKCKAGQVCNFETKRCRKRENIPEGVPHLETDDGKQIFGDLDVLNKLQAMLGGKVVSATTKRVSLIIEKEPSPRAPSPSRRASASRKAELEKEFVKALKGCARDGAACPDDQACSGISGKCIKRIKKGHKYLTLPNGRVVVDEVSRLRKLQTLYGGDITNERIEPLIPSPPIPSPLEVEEEGWEVDIDEIEIERPVLPKKPSLPSRPPLPSRPKMKSKKKVELVVSPPLTRQRAVATKAPILTKTKRQVFKECLAELN